MNLENIEKEQLKADNQADSNKETRSGEMKNNTHAQNEPHNEEKDGETSEKKKDNVPLKEAQVCRVFFSSPFRGMEAERELLTKQYFPTLRSLCNIHGVQFIPVDMRWGISHELSSNAKTVEICLREIDRSDIFVGFFGQRYGWHGLDDPDLQENMANAASKYTWIDNYRDKSVTELEFLHGHLNSPGKTPAIIAFRDKTYDDEMRQKAEKANDARGIAAFSSESPHATEYMENLKERVKNSEGKALAVHMSYKDAAEGARLMFDALKKHIEAIMTEISSTEASSQSKIQSHHKAFRKSRVGVYVGGNKYIEALDEHITSEDKQCKMVIGDGGCGKSALLANWLNHRRRKRIPNELHLYHFVACAEGTTKAKDIALNLVSQLVKALLKREVKEKKLLNQKLNAAYTANRAMDLRDLMKTFSEKIKLSESHGLKLVIIVDGLDKINQDTTSIQLFTWLPKDMLLTDKGHKIILSTLSQDEAHIKELQDNWKAETLSIVPLELPERQEICVKMLKLRGKELSDKQLSRVSEAEKSDNPLFLKIVLEELCAFGSFRQLDQKINSLISSKDVTQLFQLVLERLEEDYNTPEFQGNLVEETLCRIGVSRLGLKEDDMIRMLNIDSHVWSPLFFALEQYISVRNGLLGFVYREMKLALVHRYMENEDKKRHFATSIVDHLLDRLQQLRNRSEKNFPKYWSSTLTWMCRKYELKGRLVKVLTNLKIAEDLLDLSFWELLNSWNYLGCKGQEIVHLYNKYGIDPEISKLYAEYMDGLLTPKRLVTESIRIVYNLVILVNDRLKYMKAGLRPLHRAKQILNTTTHLPKDDPKYIEWYMDIGNQLACAYGDMTMYDKSLYYHEDVLAFCKSQKKQTITVRNQTAMSMHGVGLAYMKQEKYKEAEDMFNRSIKLTEELNAKDKTRKIAQTYTNMGLMYWQQNEIDKAIEYTEKCIKMYQDYHFGKDTIDVAYAYTNLGIFYRKKRRLDDAEKVYKKSMDIKIKQLGYQHYDIAVGYINLQNLCLQRKQYKEGLEYVKKAWDIYTAIDAADLIPARQCYENLILLLIKCNQWTEAEEKYWVVYEWLKKPGGLGLNKGLPFVHKQMVLYFYRHRQFDKLSKILPSIMGSRFLMPIHYAILAKCDHIEGITSRPEELTLEYGINKHPLNQELRRPPFVNQLIPNRDTEGMVAQLNKFFDICVETNPTEVPAEALDLAIFCAYTCREEGFFEGAKRIEEWMVERFPPKDDFTLKSTIKEVAEDLFPGIGPTAVEDEKVITYSTAWLNIFGQEDKDNSIVKLLIEATRKLKSLDEAKQKWNERKETCDEETRKKIDELLDEHEQKEMEKSPQ